jgi:hypothetical protein
MLQFVKSVRITGDNQLLLKGDVGRSDLLFDFERDTIYITDGLFKLYQDPTKVYNEEFIEFFKSLDGRQISDFTKDEYEQIRIYLSWNYYDPTDKSKAATNIRQYDHVVFGHAKEGSNVLVEFLKLTSMATVARVGARLTAPLVAGVGPRGIVQMTDNILQISRTKALEMIQEANDALSEIHIPDNLGDADFIMELTEVEEEVVLEVLESPAFHESVDIMVEETAADFGNGIEGWFNGTLSPEKMAEYDEFFGTEAEVAEVAEGALDLGVGVEETVVTGGLVQEGLLGSAVSSLSNPMGGASLSFWTLMSQGKLADLFRTKGEVGALSEKISHRRLQEMMTAPSDIQPVLDGGWPSSFDNLPVGTKIKLMGDPTLYTITKRIKDIDGIAYETSMPLRSTFLRWLGYLARGGSNWQNITIPAGNFEKSDTEGIVYLHQKPTDWNGYIQTTISIIVFAVASWLPLQDMLSHLFGLPTVLRLGIIRDLGSNLVGIHFTTMSQEMFWKGGLDVSACISWVVMVCFAKVPCF